MRNDNESKEEKVRPIGDLTRRGPKPYPTARTILQNNVVQMPSCSPLPLVPTTCVTHFMQGHISSRPRPSYQQTPAGSIAITHRDDPSLNGTGGS